MRANVVNDKTVNMGPEKLREPEPGPGEVLIDVAGCGVCHTDLHVLRDEVAFPRPAVLGHEVSGTVGALGEGVEGLCVGDRVVSSFIMPCGTCRHCVRGHDDLCETFFSHNRLKGTLYDGTTRLYRENGDPVAMYSMGGLAERCVVPATDVFHVPENLDLAEAAVLGCGVFTALGAVRNVGRVSVGDTVAVVAAGGVGMNIIQLAAVFGASTIIAVDVAEEKFELARRMGATHTVDARDPDHVEQIRRITGGRGVDVAFEALGSSATVETAVRAVDDGGRVVLVGIAPAGVTAPLNIAHVVRRKIQILGSYGARTRTDMPLVLSLAAEGRIDVSGMVTDRFDLVDAAQAYRLLGQGHIVGRGLVTVGSR